jgi:hypothetical protein
MTMRNPLTRRAALTGAIPAAAAITLPATAATAAMAAASHADAVLLAIGPKLEAMLAEWEAALHDQSIAKEAFFAEKPDQPKYPEIENAVGPLEYVAAFADYELAHRAWEVEISRLASKHKFDETAERAGDLGDVFHAALDELAEMAATTIAGLKFKARWIEHQDDDEVSASIARDLLAMPGGAGPWVTADPSMGRYNYGSHQRASSGVPRSHSGGGYQRTCSSGA